MSQRWARLPERGHPLALRLIRWIALRLGRPVGRALLYPITLYFLLTAREARRGSWRYLRRALGREPSWRDRFRHIHCFAATLLDRVYFLTGRLDRFKMAIFGDPLILEQAASGRGCILLGSHLGSFDALRALGVTQRRLPIKILMNTEHNRAMTGLLTALNPELARAIIPIGQPDTLLKVQESLERGDMIGVLGDRVVTGEKTARCRFLGREAAFPTGPLLLAALMGCPVILFFALYRGDDRYEAHFEKLAERLILDRRRRAEQLGVWAQRYADRLEHHARRAPYNWFNFYDYWEEDARPAARPARRFARQRGMGWDGLAMLALSNLALLATGGLSGLWLLRRVWRIARAAPFAEMAGDPVVVLGMRLRRDQVGRDYAQRLHRAAALHRADPRRRILLLGGPTGGGASEAERGRRFLLDRGLPASCLNVEDQSLHTLDNLRRARQWLADGGERPFVLVTSRYHLARGLALAHGLGLHPAPCAAEERLRLDPATLWRLALEAYYLHWYEVGKAWSRWTRNRANLARIT